VPVCWGASVLGVASLVLQGGILRRVVVVLSTSLFIGLLILFSIPINSTRVSADDPPVTTTTTIDVGPIPTTIVVTVPPTTTKPPKPPKPGPTTTTRPPLPTTTVSPTTTPAAPTTAPTTSTAPTSTQVAPTVTTIGSPTPTTAVEVTIPVDGSGQLTTTATTHRFFPRASTTTVGVEQIAPGLTIVIEPTTTSSAPTITFGFVLNIADLQQYEAPTKTTVAIVARVELAHSNIISPKEVKSSGVNIQAILLVLIGALIMGAVVFIVVGEHHLRNYRALSRAKR